MLEAFEIILDHNPANIYRQGESLNGQIKILLVGHKKITELSVTFRGEASTYTSWLHKRGTNLTAEQCGASETYFEENLTIIDEERFLQRGEHAFRFKFTIPSHLNLPASFEGDHGHVKYFVSARLNTYLYVKKIFTVVGGQAEVLDVDSLLTAMGPVSKSAEKIIPRLCCFTGSITLFAQTDKKGYLPGDTIILCGSIINHSHRQINQLCTRLVQKAMYANCSEFPTGESQRVLVEEVHDFFCNRSSSVPFSNKTLAVPSCAPSGLPGCEIIDVQYFVYIEAEACVWMSIDIGVGGRVMTTLHKPSDVTNQPKDSGANPHIGSLKKQMVEESNGGATPYVNNSPNNTLYPATCEVSVTSQSEETCSGVEMEDSKKQIVEKSNGCDTPYVNNSPNETLTTAKKLSIPPPQGEDSSPLQEIPTIAKPRRSIPSVLLTSKDDQLPLILVDKFGSDPITGRPLTFRWPDPPDFATQDLTDQLELIPLTPLNQNKDLNHQSNSPSKTAAPAPSGDMWQLAAVPILAPPDGFADRLSMTPISEAEEMSPPSTLSLQPAEENGTIHQQPKKPQTNISTLQDESDVTKLLTNMQSEQCQTIVAEEFSFLSFDHF